MAHEDQKRRVALAALELIKPFGILGVGTGSTVNIFIDALADVRHSLEAAVASSEATSERLRARGIEVVELNTAGPLTVYVDGADETNRFRQLIKGGGGALTREKICAAAAGRFVCMVDQSKRVGRLGRFPLPVEVIPMARSFVARELVKLGGVPVLRENFLTDNGNVILDVKDLEINEPCALEEAINQIPGVVTNGLFALRPADIVLIGTDDGIERLEGA